MLVGTVVFVATYAARMPILDDLEVLRLWLPTNQRDLANLWTQHNEHRIPIPRVIQVALLEATGDFRSGMYFTAAVNAVVAGAMILAARRLRGSTSFTDAFFPLVWMSTGNSDNLLMGFQLSLALPTALVCAVLISAVNTRGSFRTRSAWLVAVVMVALPLCGGPGLTQLPPLLAGAVLLALLVVARRVQSPRAAGWILLGGSILTIAIVALYMVGFVFTSDANKTTDPVRILEVAARVASQALGRSGLEWWPWSFVIVLATALYASWLLAVHFRREPPERLRAAGIVCVLAAASCLCLSIGYGRGGSGAFNGFAPRYIGLPAPILCAAYFAIALYARPLASVLVRGGLVVVLALGALVNDIPIGRHWGGVRRDFAQGIRAEILSGRAPEDVFARFGREVYGDPRGFFHLFPLMADFRVPPFDELDDAGRAEWTGRKRVFVTPFERIESSPGGAHIRRTGAGLRVLATAPDTAVYLTARPGNRRVRGRFGALGGSDGMPPGAPVRIHVALTDGVQRWPLFERVLDPEREPADRGPQTFDVALPHAEGGTVVVRVVPFQRAGPPAAWGWLEGLAVE